MSRRFWTRHHDFRRRLDRRGAHIKFEPRGQYSMVCARANLTESLRVREIFADASKRVYAYACICLEVPLNIANGY
jgi:hypothetical protein